jgi:hypothetical protein
MAGMIDAAESGGRLHEGEVAVAEVDARIHSA